MRFVIMSILAVLLFVMFAGSASAAPEELLHRHRHVAEVAEAQVGDAYVYGAAGPDVFDCSGLSMYAWSMYRNLSHNAAAQFASLPPIAESFVMRGDLVYFNFDGGDVDHVGVLVSPNRMVHASDRVEEDSLTGYYRSAIVGYRRPDRT